MRALHHPGRKGESAADNTRRSQDNEPGSNADNIDDRIEGADFVEVNLFRWDAMHLPFRQGETMKNPPRQRAYRRR